MVHANHQSLVQLVHRAGLLWKKFTFVIQDDANLAQLVRARDC